MGAAMNGRTVRIGNREIPVDEFLRLINAVEDAQDESDSHEEELNTAVAIEPQTAQEQGRGNIIKLIADFVRRFVFLKDECLYVLTGTWILATYLYKEFECMGYLFAYSPERQSGKTKLLDVLDMIVYESTGVQVSPSEAVLFRTAENHTQLLDEVDSWKNNEHLREVLNAGYRKGGAVTRCDKTRNGFEPKPYPVYAPRALAGIGLRILDSTTLDRTFAIEMARQRKSEKRERLLPRVVRREVEGIKKTIQKWVDQNRDNVAEMYAQGKFPDLEPFSDRTIEITEPLAAILDVACEGAELSRCRGLLLQAIALTRREQQSASQDHQLLKHLLELARENDPLVGNASEIAAMCGNLEGGSTEYDVSRVLRKYGFKSKSIRLNGAPLRRYRLMRTALEELVERWVPSGEDQE
jgi:hypothetical protein